VREDTILYPPRPRGTRRGRRRRPGTPFRKNRAAGPPPDACRASAGRRPPNGTEVVGRRRRRLPGPGHQAQHADRGVVPAQQAGVQVGRRSAVIWSSRRYQIK